MIYTVTLNPSIDYIMQVPTYEAGATNRATAITYYPGGKGINVSRILASQQINTTAWGLLGGFTGSFVNDTLATAGITLAFTPITGTTRINVKLKGQTETEINAPGPDITATEWTAFKAQFANLAAADTVIFSGSAPKSLAGGVYQELIALVKIAGAQFIIDTTGADMRQALSKQPLLVKPNREEVAALYDVPVTTQADLKAVGARLLADGAQNAIISMAGDGALLFTATGTYFAAPIQGQLKNSVGAGDSMIGGFLAAWSQTQDSLASFKQAVACGTATAFSDDIADAALINELVAQVKIAQLD